MELAIQKYIREFGLDSAIEKFKLKSNDYPNKVILKYDQINSSYEHQEVLDSRGIILEKGTWDIMSMAFSKFFNHEEGFAAKLNEDNVLVFEKLDGSLMTIYWDWNKNTWEVSTSGMAEAEGNINGGITTFRTLFWNTILKYPGKFNGLRIAKSIFKDVAFVNAIKASGDYSAVFNHPDFSDYLSEFLMKGNSYVFELTTPWNIVVVPHTTSNVTLLTVRNLETLKELSYVSLVLVGIELDLPVVKAYSMNDNSFAALRETFRDMPFDDEGYVRRDDNDNRDKIKNPAYVAAHHLKSSLAEYRIMTIVKNNEIAEFGATFPDRLNELKELKLKYDELYDKLEFVWSIIKLHVPAVFDAASNKAFATNVFAITKEYSAERWSSLFFNLKDGKVANIKDYMYEIQDKKIYFILKE